jgi:DNA polymerase III subunit gamma/tau
MTQVLYRKYRAQSFNELVGQEHISAILKNAVKKGSLSHAYLFTGSRGTGKTSTARILVKAINCLNPSDGNPCNECDNCIAITAGRFMDLVEIDAASNRGIDQIRDLKEKIEFSPVEGKYKVYIIDEVHMMTSEAFNALLKTLEEPPSHVIFILATTDPHKLPPTIISRSQRYDFRLGSDEEIEGLLKAITKKEKIKISDEGLKILVHNAKGSFRDALSLLDVVYSGQIDSAKPKEISVNEIRDILGIPDSTMVYYLLEKIVFNDKVAALQMVEEIDKKGVNLQQFVKYTLYMLKDILVKKMRGDFDPKEYSFAEDLSVSDIVKLINGFLNVERNLKTSPIPVLELEVLIGSFGVQEDVVESRFTKKKVIVKKKEKEGLEKKEKKETKEETKKEKKEEEVNTNGNLTIDEIKKNWKKLTKKIQPANGHLFAFLDRVNILTFENGKLMLEVPFQFHKDRIEDPKSREAIAIVCKEVYGATFCYECVVNSDIVSKRQVDPSVIFKKDSGSEDKKKEEKKTTNKTKRKVEEIFSDM